MLNKFTNKVLQVVGNELRIPVTGTPLLLFTNDISVGDIKNNVESHGNSIRFTALNGAEISSETPSDELLRTIFTLDINDSIFKVFPPSGKSQ